MNQDRRKAELAMELNSLRVRMNDCQHREKWCKLELRRQVVTNELNRMEEG